MGTRHAFLVMAHDEYPLLETLISLLDSPRADIYVHVDARSPIPPSLDSHASDSEVVTVPRRAVRWSGYSQVEAELDLLGAALPGEYSYYHLLSGHDLPVTPQAELYDFFNKHAGTEFVDCWATPDNGRFSATYLDRVRFYTPVEPPSRGSSAARAINHSTAAVQRILGVDRTGGQKFAYGSNWFSISHELATYVLEQKPFIRRTFSHTRSPDELFLQTIVWNSSFRDRLYEPGDKGTGLGNARYIDWSRLGEAKYSPYVIRASDVEGVRRSGCMFARKFSLSVDSEAVKQVSRIVRGQGELSV